MKTYQIAIIVCLGVILTAGALFAQPANDSCAGAVVVDTLPYTYSQNTRLATPDPADPILACADSGGGKSVWFIYTADSTRYLRFSTARSTPADYDVAMGLYTGVCGDLVEVDCNDDIVPGSVRQAVIGIEVQAGTTYYIHIAEWNGGGPNGGVPTGGDLILDVFESTPDPIYLGPKTGSVAGGGSITLGMVPGNIPIIVGDGTPAHEPNLPDKLLPAPIDVHPARGPAGSNFIKDPSVSSVAAVGAQPVVLKNFRGNVNTGAVPPDPILAAGPDYVIGMVNSSFMVWDKEGTLLSVQSLQTWWNNVAAPLSFSDPQIVYDHYEHRWIMAGGNFAEPYSFLISVSDDENPFGTWHNWSLPAGLGDSLTGNLPDYPQMGYDSVAIYITSREFNPGFVYARLRIIEKSQLYKNDDGPVSWTDLWDLREPEHTSVPVGTVQPSVMFGYTGEHYMVNTSPFTVGTFFTLWKILDPVGTPSMTAEDISVVEYLPPNDAGQLGGGTAIEAGGGSIRHRAVYRDSSLWMAHSVASGTGNVYSAIRYVRINPHTGEALEDVAMGAEGFWHYYPALMADGDGNIIIAYSRSGLTEYPGGFVSGHKKTDPPGLSPSIPVAEGVGNYDVPANGRNRWGDYTGAALDPSDSLAVWVNTEYAKGTNTWETRVGMVKMGPLPGAFVNVNLSALTFGTIEVTDTSAPMEFFISSNGIDTLNVASVDLPDSNFKLLDPPSFPISIPTFAVETLRVIFAPVRYGTFSDSLLIHSNDTLRPTIKISLSGKGFSIDPAVSGTMYAGTGSADSGRLRTVNPVDGTTMAVGPSGFVQLLNLRVHPVTGELMGLAINSATTAANYDIVRVNTSLADAHTISRIPLNFIKGMAYHDDTLYVARITGAIYWVDPGTGTPTQVAASGKNLSAIDFNPVTGELWAGVSRGSPVDAIYKIDLATGTPTLVGTTGFNVPTVDIAFDAIGKLLGIIGTGTAPSQLISIDTATGAGTVIGPLGITSAQGIAFHPDVVTDIYLDPGLDGLPHRYALGQNYPNPFNPATTVGYELPEAGHVKLVLFNTLGEEVLTLVDAEQAPGYYHLTIPGGNIASGVYFYRLTAGAFSAVRKMVLIR